MSKDNKANLKAHHGAHSEPQHDLLAMFIRFIVNVLSLAILIIIGLSFMEACQPKPAIERSGMEGRP